jgi:hypothetical protein
MELFLTLLATLLIIIFSTPHGALQLFRPSTAAKIQKITHPALILLLTIIIFLFLLPKSVEAGLKVWQAYAIIACGLLALLIISKIVIKLAANLKTKFLPLFPSVLLLLAAITLISAQSKITNLPIFLALLSGGMLALTMQEIIAYLPIISQTNKKVKNKD